MNYEFSHANNAAVLNAVNALLDDAKVKSASAYQSPKLVITATRRGKTAKRDTTVELVLTVGQPNYRGREFVKACVKAREPFPVRRVQVRWMKGVRVEKPV